MVERAMSEAEQKILVELRALRADQAAQREAFEDLTRRLMGPADRRALVRLLPLVYAFIGEAVWSGPSLYFDALSLAALNANAATGLLAELAPWHTETGGFRSFGRFLGRVSGSTSAGLRLVAVGGTSDRDGLLYAVKRVSSRSKPAPLVDA